MTDRSDMWNVVFWITFWGLLITRDNACFVLPIIAIIVELILTLRNK